MPQRLDIQFDGEELHASLSDISAGVLGVTVPDTLQIGQSLQAVISTLEGGHSLKLRARVVRQQPNRKISGIDDPDTHQNHYPGPDHYGIIYAIN